MIRFPSIRSFVMLSAVLICSALIAQTIASGTHTPAPATTGSAATTASAASVAGPVATGDTQQPHTPWVLWAIVGSGSLLVLLRPRKRTAEAAPARSSSSSR